MLLRNSVQTMFIRSMVQRRFFKWIDKHVPNKNAHTLTVKNLYIVPSKLGGIYLGICVLLWVFGTNYQNNLILAFDFFLLSILMLGILRTFTNLNGILLQYKSALPVYPGEHINLRFEISTLKSAYGIVLKWQQEDKLYRFSDFIGQIDSAVNKTRISVPLLAKKRGRFSPGRLLIESHFPIGLVRCWSWLNWDIDLLVYPKPIEVPEPPTKQQATEDGESHPAPGAEDFSGLRGYQRGDSPKRIAWKTYAKGKGLFTKEFEQSVSSELWLDYNFIHGGDMEIKISGLTYWALRYHEKGVEFGLKLPNEKISPDKGDDHLHCVLSLLAVYGG